MSDKVMVDEFTAAQGRFAGRAYYFHDIKSWGLTVYGENAGFMELTMPEVDSLIAVLTALKEKSKR